MIWAGSTEASFAKVGGTGADDKHCGDDEASFV